MFWRWLLPLYQVLWMCHSTIINSHLLVCITFTCMGPKDVRRRPITCLVFTYNLYDNIKTDFLCYTYQCNDIKNGRNASIFLQSGLDHYIWADDYLYMLHKIWRLNVLFRDLLWGVEDFREWVFERCVNKEKKCLTHLTFVLVWLDINQGVWALLT